MTIPIRGNRPRPLLLFLLLVAVVSPSRQAVAQEGIRVPSEPICEGCTIELEHLVSMGQLDGPGAIGRPSAVVRNSRQEYFVVSQETTEEITVFNRHGQFIKTIGRNGQGPGEYRGISALLVLPGDTLLVFDGGNSRVGVLSPEGEWVRGIRYPGMVESAASTSEGLLAVAGRVADPDRIGFPLHYLGMDGALGVSFGMDPPAYRSDMYYFIKRFLARANGGGLWVAHHMEYVIERWDVDGVLKRTLLRDADWFPPQFTQRNFTKDTPEHPSIFAIHEDSQGRLWVAIRVNEPDWWRGIGEETLGPEGPIFPILDIDQLYGTRLEVIDPQLGRVVAETYSDELVVAFLKGGDLVSYQEGDGGVPRLSVWRATIREQGGNRR